MRNTSEWPADDIEILISQYGDMLYRLCLIMLKNESDAEDAVQELYIRLHAAVRNGKAPKNMTAYAMSVLKNICIDTMRRRMVRKAETVDERIPLEDPLPDSRMASKDMLERLMTEMDKLPDPQARILKMKALEGLDYKEISERTGLSQVHVRVLVSMARKTLKRKTGL